MSEGEDVEDGREEVVHEQLVLVWWGLLLRADGGCVWPGWCVFTIPNKLKASLG